MWRRVACLSAWAGIVTSFWWPSWELTFTVGFCSYIHGMCHGGLIGLERISAFFARERERRAA